ncbi:unnamed protein product, partial [Mesorhabditis belari]|uniref:RING-type E3 ubiquitin transferase n=1 Tax=Mesorhabditis belari TaxID=2138241 RepID=A0AAF3J6T6_9BILA
MSAPAPTPNEAPKRAANQENSGGSSGGRGGRSYYRKNNNNHTNNQQQHPRQQTRGDNQTRDVDHRERRPQRQQGSGEVDMRKYYRMIADAQNNFADIVQTEGVKEDCTICCKPNDLFGIGQCRHPLCIECSIRLRIICGQSACPVCRAEIDIMCFFFAKAGLSTVDLNLPTSEHPDEERYKIRFQNGSAGERYEKYLAHVCKVCKVEEGERKEFPTFVSLRQHMSQVHQLSFCHICTDNINLLSRERKTYTREQLQRHIKNGDPEDKSQKGHPSCLFCEQRFFDEEARYRHLRKDHFFCQFCEAEGVAMNIFYGRHSDLTDHYSKEHLVCDVLECKNAGIAFSNQMDLKLHMSKEHGNGRQGLAIDFPMAGRQLGGRGRGRGGQMNREAEERANLPPPTRGVIVVPAEPVQKTQSDPSEFVMVPSAQHRGPIRFHARPAYDTSANREQFPSLPGASTSAGPPRGSYPFAPKTQQATSQKGATTQAEAFPSLGRGSVPVKAPNAQWARHTGQFEIIDQDVPRARPPAPSGGPPSTGSQQQTKARKVARPVEDFPGLPSNSTTHEESGAKGKNWASKVATSQSSSGGLIIHAQPSQQKKKKPKNKKRQEANEPHEYIEPPEPEWEEVPTKPKPMKMKKGKNEKNQIIDVVVPTGFSTLNRRLSSNEEEESGSDEELKTTDGLKSMSEVSRLVNNNEVKDSLPNEQKKPKAGAKTVIQAKDGKPSTKTSTIEAATPQEPATTGLFGMFSISGVLSNLASGFSKTTTAPEPPPGLAPSTKEMLSTTPVTTASNGLSFGPPPGFESVVPKSSQDAQILTTGIGLLIRVAESVYGEIQGQTTYSMKYCTILGAVHLFGYHMNQMAIAVIAFDRLYGIVSPIGYKNRDPKPYVIKSFFLVLIPAIVGIGIRLREVQYEEGDTEVCNLSTTKTDGIFAVYWWSPFFLGNSILIFVFYGVTIYLVRKGFHKEGSEREFSRQRKVFFTISLVLLTYICCTMMPAIFVSIGVFAKADPSWFSAVCIYGGLVSGFNSASNILIYGWKYEELRTYMIQVITCRQSSTLKRDNSSYNVLRKNSRRDVLL